MINIVNERKLAESLAKNFDLINDNTYNRLVAYTKYLKQKGETKRNIRNIIDNLMERYYIGFVMADWDDLLQKIVNRYSKNDSCAYRDVKQIYISKAELDFIHSSNNVEIEKLLFVLLVLAKLNKNDNNDKLICSYESKDIFTLSKYKYKNRIPRDEQRDYLLHDISETGLITFINRCDSLGIILNYGNLEDINDGLSFFMDEDNYKDIVYYYLVYIGDKSIKQCEVCGKYFKSKSKKNNQKYCNKCSIDRQKERDKQYQKNKYNS